MTNPAPKAARRRLFLEVLRNIPAAVTVLASAGVAIASTVVTISTPSLIQVILGLLALLGTTQLIEQLAFNRDIKSRLDGVQESVSRAIEAIPSGDDKALDDLLTNRQRLAPLEDRLSGARRVAISGGSLSRLTSEYKGLFEELLISGCEVRFLLTAPTSEAATFLGTAVSYEYRNEGYVAQGSVIVVGRGC